MPFFMGHHQNYYEIYIYGEYILPLLVPVREILLFRVFSLQLSSPEQYFYLAKLIYRGPTLRKCTSTY